MIDETLEYSICQYLDGELAPHEVAALQKRLAEDPEAAALLEEYRKLNGAMDQAFAMPAVRWDALAAGLSATIEEEEQAQRMRISTWLTTGVRLAMAAAVILAVALFASLYKSGDTAGPADPLVATSHVLVEGPLAEAPRGPAVADVEILPPTLAEAPGRSAEAYAMEGLISLPSRIVVIASESDSGQDILR
jgi:anti-sigma factor RsiW